MKEEMTAEVASFMSLRKSATAAVHGARVELAAHIDEMDRPHTTAMHHCSDTQRPQISPHASLDIADQEWRAAERRRLHIAERQRRRKWLMPGGRGSSARVHPQAATFEERHALAQEATALIQDAFEDAVAARPKNLVPFLAAHFAKLASAPQVGAAGMEHTSTNPLADAPTITSMKEPAPIEASRACLLVVDVQPEYWTRCTDPSIRRDFARFPARCERTIEIARERGCTVVWVRADYQSERSPWLAQFERLHGGTKQAELPCDVGSLEWESFATPREPEVVLPKSSWCASSGLVHGSTATAGSGRLVPHLRALGIETVLCIGLLTSVCVQHSAFGVFEAGFRTLVVTDACADRGKERHDAALMLYGNYMYEVTTSAQLEHTAFLVPSTTPAVLGKTTGKPKVLGAET